MIIYEILEKPTKNSLYVGKSTKYNNNEEFQESSYWGSGKCIKNVVKKHGTKNLERKILEKGIRTLEKLKKREEFWIKEKNTLWPNGYNLTDKSGGGDNISNHPDKEKIAKEHSKWMKTFLLTSEGRYWKEKQRKKIKYFLSTPEGNKWRKKQKEKQEYFLKTPEGIKWRKDHSEKLKGRFGGKKSPHWGKPRTKKQKIEISTTLKNYFQTIKGKKEKEKMRERNKGDKNPAAREVVLISPDGIPHPMKSYRQFCTDNNLLNSAICAVLKGKHKHHHGWTGRYLDAK